MSRHSVSILIVTAFMILLASCGSSRRGSDVRQYTPDGQAGLEWTDLRLPVTVNISEPTSIKVSGVMTMTKDKDIQVSLRMFGFEVGALYVTGDSVFAYAKLQKVYLAERISEALGGMDADVSDLQALLIGLPVDLPKLTRHVNVSYTPLEGTPFASSVAIAATHGSKKLEATLTYDWSRAGVDKGNLRPFTLPRGYQRIDAARLLRSLSSH